MAADLKVVSINTPSLASSPFDAWVNVHPSCLYRRLRMAATPKQCIAFDNERYDVNYCAMFTGVQAGRAEAQEKNVRTMHRTSTTERARDPGTVRGWKQNR